MSLVVKILSSILFVLLIAHPCWADESIAETETKIEKAMTKECRSFAADSGHSL